MASGTESPITIATEPMLVENVSKDEEQSANNSSPTTNDETEPMMDDDRHDHDEEHCDDDDDIDEDEEPAPKEWDEGGKSHCGYGDSVHETLMSIGESIHKVVGEPNEGVQTAMKGIGNWFQEASYAARDLRRGKMDILAEDTQEAMKSVVSGDEDEAEGEKDEDEDKLKPVKEDESQKDGVTA
mmetsp:Transcript_10459/g.15897  ORF Transcript_10459/g.15897 Transcript_10459/m.15897 type:complete len:184 (-) Transcript_10459:182-733(-)|eukprot:CAMPEP_0196142024 /NCGR_PEP_ID=MMETSP0910-20130528/10795_1 /TAXON_ID=49265 /ORGANISM="Thalassiosira rotula, Strain GSO102" /LENGTH=183 /DNA_ID=CAMNT_0041403271 /DNA_START=99 /DNA_END=650 /DNA_ORIENTATION=+